MSNIAIKVEDLSKRYRIGLKEEMHDTLVAAVSEFVKRPVKNLRRLRRLSKFTKVGQDSDDIIWALKDVCLEVHKGEVVGIIGPNGAGKTTLLRILSSITEPTRGKVYINGRVGSILEVGTGFHPELTGRENVYLNGTMLGMSKREVDRKFDEIVDFSGVEKFIDTPVKRYSSGMKVRLAFSVAAHLEPEILLVDEVLAVGDAAFQKKCLGKMQDVSGKGRTVLFVSHNMPAIRSLCPRAILLEQGAIGLDAPSHEVVGRYMSEGLETTAEKTWPNLWEAPGNEIVRLRAVRVRDEEGQVCEFFDIRKPVGIEMEFDVIEGGHVLVPGFRLFTDTGVIAFSTYDLGQQWRRRPRPKGRFVSTAWIPGNFLADGAMFVTAGIITSKLKKLHFFVQNALAFTVMDSLGEDTARGDWPGGMPGVVRPLLQWSTHFTPAGDRTDNMIEKEYRS